MIKVLDQLNVKLKTFKGLVRDERRKDKQPRTAKKCQHCNLNMLVAGGQTAYWHSECRAKGRRLLVRQK